MCACRRQVTWPRPPLPWPYQPWAHEASTTEDGIDLVVDDARENLPAILSDAATAGAAIKSVEVTEPDLEAVFLHLTGRALRD